MTSKYTVGATESAIVNRVTWNANSIAKDLLARCFSSCAVERICCPIDVSALNGEIVGEWAAEHVLELFIRLTCDEWRSFFHTWRTSRSCCVSSRCCCCSWEGSAIPVSSFYSHSSDVKASHSIDGIAIAVATERVSQPPPQQQQQRSLLVPTWLIILLYCVGKLRAKWSCLEMRWIPTTRLVISGMWTES